MATYITEYPGNLALETDIWTLSLAEAHAVCAVLPCTTGSYWETTVAIPTRRAVWQKATTVRIYTAGFSSGELSNALYTAGMQITA